MEKIPYQVHGFVCTNDRHGERKSCADGGVSVVVRKELKARLKEKGWWGKEVRVSTSGCLGLCTDGPNMVLFPKGEVISHITPDHVEQIMERIKAAISD